MTNTFHKYDNWEHYKDTQVGRQKAYDTLARMLSGTRDGKDTGKPYVIPGSATMDASTAQTYFVAAEPEAAMYLCGPWLPTEEAEMLEFLGDDFEYGFFGIPHINADKKDAFGNDSSNVRYSLASNSLVVPKTSNNKAGAKLFLAELYHNERSSGRALRGGSKYFGCVHILAHDAPYP